MCKLDTIFVIDKEQNGLDLFGNMPLVIHLLASVIHKIRLKYTT